MASWVGHTRVEGSEQTVSQPANNIDNCCFVDRQCNSDQQWTDGYWAFQNGQCAAPIQTQTQVSTPASTAGSPQIDNCCFVDRVCATDAEWTDGYYAFQNSQCAAPAGSQTAAQPARNVPADVDNCCFVDRQCATDEDWTNGFYAYVVGQCAAPGSHVLPRPLPITTQTIALANFNFNNCCYMHHGTCHSTADWERGRKQYKNHQCLRPLPIGTRPATVGNAKFEYLVNRALEAIRIHVPEWLNYIDSSGARELRLMPLGGSGGFYNQSWTIGHEWLEHERNDTGWMPDDAYIVGYAGGITHEACHSMAQRTHTQTRGPLNELPCMEAQLAVIEALDPNSKDIWWLQAAIAELRGS